jgi:D-alanyl-D-alanine carboxypeptidase/D-alanyl-D-alanine-endopeptidase (penicillin-binding protein 4)
MKLLTASALLTRLDPASTLTTGVVRSGRTLYLVGGGDPTLTAHAAAGYPPPASLVALAARTAQALGGGSGPWRLRYDATAWTGPSRAPGWSAAYFSAGDIAPLSPLEVDEGRPGRQPHVRVADPARLAATDFARALRRLQVRVTGAPRPAPAPAGGLGIASVSSAPLDALVARMLTDSDNDLAEALGRLLADRTGQASDFAGEAGAVFAAIRSLRVPSRGLRVYDASGLSRLDRLSPSTLVALIRTAQQDPRLSAVIAGLPVAGATGTLAARDRSPKQVAAAGVVRAKTGTLAGVSALAGQVVDAGGRLLDFAFVTDRAGVPTAAEAALDRLAAALARCGCR